VQGERFGDWLWRAALLILWVPILHLLSPQWSIYENYRYGWAVPFLAAYLFLRRWPDRPSPGPAHRKSPVLAIILFGLLLLPGRVLQEASPLWRLASYNLVALAVLISLTLLYRLGGSPWLRHFAFPICFLLVAVPWPTPIELFVTGSFSRINTLIVTEVMNWIGIAALAHGTVIEVGTGFVGVDEACSGIRSLQAALMIQLFLGEYYRFRLVPRLVLLGLGVFAAILLNWVRTSALVLIAAHDSPAAIERWHDPTGIVILLVSFGALWLATVWLQRRHNQVTNKTDLTHKHSSPGVSAPSVCYSIISLSLISVGASTLWFRFHESDIPRETELTLLPPKSKSNFRELPIPAQVRAQLHCDKAQSVRWINSDQTQWQLFHFRWYPAHSFTDRVSVHLAKSHRPEICLPATGRRLDQELEPTTVTLGGIEFAFRTYRFYQEDRPLYVFYCAREDGAPAGASINMRETHVRRFEAAWKGTRGLAQRVIELVIFGQADFAQARESFQHELPNLFSPVKPSSG